MCQGRRTERCRPPRSTQAREWEAEEVEEASSTRTAGAETGSRTADLGAAGFEIGSLVLNLPLSLSGQINEGLQVM